MSVFSSILKGIASLVDIGSTTPAAETTPEAPRPAAPAPESVDPEPPVMDAPEPESAPPPPPSGRIYFQYTWSKSASDDDLRDQIRNRLRKELDRKSPRLVLDDEDRADPLAAVERVLLGDGAERVFFLSNCSTGGRRSCWAADRGRCPLADQEECCLEKLPCNTILIRPKKDLPSIARMFPGDEILAVRAFLYNCPERYDGCVASIADYVWAPSCEARPFERELRASFVAQEAASRNWELRGHPDNLLTTKTLSDLPPISIETSSNLKSWTDYLDWRNRLVAENARAIRYLRAQRNHDGSVSFFAVHDGTGETPNLSWLRREELEAVPLSASADPWMFREPENDGRRQRRHFRAKLLGEADSVKPVPVANAPVPDGCPWSGLGVVEVRIGVTDERPTHGEDETNTPDEDASLLDLPSGIPETGFLRLCQRGDRSLVERMSNTINEFARNGSNAAPFLSSYLFDISQARLPVQSTPIETFLNPHLNDDQKRAVQTMVDAPDIALVQGPPGTGKTTVIAEAIYQFARAGKTVLLASQSVAAVENALGRLEHVPEIRVQLRRKPSSGSAPDEAPEPYSDGEVLREYYATLGKRAREVVSMIDEAGERRTRLRETAAELEPLVLRMKEESDAEAEAVRQVEKAGREVQAAMLRAESASASQQAREASERLLAMLPSLAPADLGDWARDVPESVITPLASAVRAAANAFESQGIRIWSDLGEDEPHRPSDIRLRTLAGAVERLRQLRNQGLPALLKCVDEWRAASGERLVDDESARVVQELTLRYREAERLRDEADDAGSDEAAYQRFDAEARRLRQEIRKAKAAAKTSVGAFREWFTVPCYDGQTLADAIEAANGNRAAILELVAGFESFAAEFLKVVADEESRVTTALRETIGVIPVDAGADPALRKARLALRDAEALVREAQERRLTFEAAAVPVLERLRSAEPGAPAEPAAAMAWCREAATEIESRTHAEHAAHPWLEPLLREWAQLTAAPNDEDLSRALPLYLESCNVVGTTCTANPGLLGDRRFDVVIVDEVSKATPPELLAPMTRGAKTILVGDHRQLPPLFDEKEPLLLEELAQREEDDENIPEERKIVKRNFKRYERMVEDSLFKRHFEHADPRLKCSLWVQHRMHPEIMNVINVFYEGRLKCGLPEDEANRLRDHGLSGGKIPWMSGARHAYWIDSTSAPDGSFFPDEPAGTSRVNGLEVQLILRALKDLDAGLDGQTTPKGDPVTKTVGVISFYGKQKGLLLREIRKLRLRHLKWRVETVDRFQGQECDYVLVSMTRNNRFKKGGTRSFIARFERINVAFSRARELLLVFGARDFFRRQPVRLPSLDGSGAAMTVTAYGYITDMLAQRGALLPAAEVISASEWKKLPQLQTGARPKPPAFEMAKRPVTPGHAFQNRQNRPDGRKRQSHAPYGFQRTNRTGSRSPQRA